jgi:hypothetical protein
VRGVVCSGTAARRGRGGVSGTAEASRRLRPPSPLGPLAHHAGRLRTRAHGRLRCPCGCPGTVVQTGVDLTLESRTLQDALRRLIATGCGYCSWDVNHASWVVPLHSPEVHDFYGKALDEALAWCLVWLMAPEIGIGPFRV